jgi:Flp pilus assembly protein TadB
MTGWALAAALLSGAAVACALSPPAPRGRRAAARPRKTPTTGAAPDLLRLRAPLSAVSGLGAAVLVGGWLGALLGAAVALTLWRLLGRMEPAVARRRRERLVEQLPGAVDLMAAALTVGVSPDTAVLLVADAVDEPMRGELALVASRLALGVDPVRLWSEIGGHPQLGPIGRCLARAVDSGAPVGEAMHRLAEDLRRTARAEVEGRARAVGVRAAAPLGVCLLPAFILTGVVPLIAGSVSTLFP